MVNVIVEGAQNQERSDRPPVHASRMTCLGSPFCRASSTLTFTSLLTSVRTAGRRATEETAEESICYEAENGTPCSSTGSPPPRASAPPGRAVTRRHFERMLPGPRLLTSIAPIDETTGTPDQIRRFVREIVTEGADVVKIFASKSIAKVGGKR